MTDTPHYPTLKAELISEIERCIAAVQQILGSPSPPTGRIKLYSAPNAGKSGVEVCMTIILNMPPESGLRGKPWKPGALIMEDEEL